MMRILKKICRKGFTGSLFGIAISYIITVIISVCIGDGYYSAVVPLTISDFGSEINAILVQVAMSFFMGFCIGAGTLIWEQDSWSLIKQSVLHFITVCIAVIPAAWICRWMSHSLVSVLRYIVCMTLVYFLIWAVQYFSIRRHVKLIDARLKEKLR